MTVPRITSTLWPTLNLLHHVMRGVAGISPRGNRTSRDIPRGMPVN